MNKEWCRSFGVGTVLGQMNLVRIFNGLSNQPNECFFTTQEQRFKKKLTCAALLLLQDVGTQFSPCASAIIDESSPNEYSLRVNRTSQRRRPPAAAGQTHQTYCKSAVTRAILLLTLNKFAYTLPVPQYIAPSQIWRILVDSRCCDNSVILHMGPYTYRP